MYLFDTDVITNPLKPVPSPKLLTRLRPLSRAEQHISAVTVGEMVFGAYRSHDPAYHLRRMELAILPRVEVIPFDEEAARKYGELRAQLERAGTPLAVPDLMIAATALSRGFVMVTGNVRHFGRVPGLKVENWLL